MILKKIILFFIRKIGFDIIYYQKQENKVFLHAINFLKKANYKKSGIFFDIGAAKGLFTKTIIESFPRVKKIFMIEPHSKMFLKLKKKYNNKIFKIYNNVAFNKKEKKLFYEYNNNEISSIYKIRNEHEFYYGVNNPLLDNISKVKTVKLDDIVNRFNIQMIDLIKIDVQGSEMQVLEGLKKTLRVKKIYMLLVEVSCSTANDGIYENNSDISEIISFMNSYKYKIKSVIDISLNKDKSLKQLELIFIQDLK